MDAEAAFLVALNEALGVWVTESARILFGAIGLVKFGHAFA